MWLLCVLWEDLAIRSKW